MKRFIMVLLVFTWLILFICEIGWAEDVDLERIVVTPSRTEESYDDIGQKVDVITSKDIEESSAKDISEVLTKFTSVNISDYGAAGATKTIRMRGSTASQVLILVDGRPINNPRDGEADLSSIPLDNIERIELLHGPAASLYGSQAMAGAVNIITKRPPEKKQKTEIYSSFGTFRTYVEKFLNGGRISKLGYIVSGQYEISDGFRNNSDFDAKDFNTKFEYKLNDINSLTLNSGFYISKTGAPGPITSPDNDDRQNALKNFTDFSWDLKPDNTTHALTRIYNNYDRLEFIENTAGSAFDVAFSKAIHTTKVTGINLQFNKQISEKYRLTTGFDYIKNRNDSTSSAKHEYIVRAFYIGNQVGLFENLETNINLRIDDYSNFGTEINPNLSVLYRFNKDSKLHGLVSKSFRAPTFNDLYWPDEGWARGNPDVKPEKGITAELGFETKICRNILTDVTYYRNYFNELINWVEDNGVWQPNNIGSAVIEGIELENNISLNKNFSAQLDYTYLRAKNNKSRKYLIYQPKDKVDFSLKYKNLNGFKFELTNQFTGGRFHDTDNNIKVKRFFVLGLNLSQKFKQGITCFMSINNLFNRKYQVIRDYPMPGFSLTGGVKLEF